MEEKVTISEEEWKILEGGSKVPAELWERLGRYTLQGKMPSSSCCWKEDFDVFFLNSFREAPFGQLRYRLHV